MKQGLRKVITRIRRVQDAVFNHRLADCHCIDISANTFVKQNGNADEFFTVSCHTSNGTRLYILCDQPEWQIEQKIADMSNFIGYPV